MSGRNRGYKKYDENQNGIAKEIAVSLPPDSAILKIFKGAFVKLRLRQDRHERLVKLSRDITIESKRIIFLLHSAIREEDQQKAAEEASGRLQKLINKEIKSVGLELEHVPAYLHSRALSPGFQEFTEAYTLCHLLKEKKLIKWSEVQNMLKYDVTNEDEIKVRTVETLLPINDFMLGLADLTGELMRRTINSISSGDTQECYRSCQLVRDLYSGFLGLYGFGRTIARKLNTTRANVAKVERAVYTLRVRGGEVPPKLLMPLPGEWDEHRSDDEGFY